MRVLIVGKSPNRVGTIIEAFHEHLQGKVPPRLFLIADRTTQSRTTGGLLGASWQDMEGNTQTLFD